MRWLDRNGLVKRARDRRNRAQGTPLSAGTAPNALWCADFKGEFKLAHAFNIIGLLMNLAGVILLFIASSILRNCNGSYNICHNLKGGVITFVIVSKMTNRVRWW
jgi:hypothetical protein